MSSEGKRRARSDSLNLARLEEAFQLVKLLGASGMLRHRRIKGNSRTRYG
jgi:hypothetical protein